MATSTRFSVAVHALAALALHRDKPMTSEEIAGSVCTNPAVIRRLLSDLARAGLTASQLGKGGGALLAKKPKKISLLDIYLAVERPGLIARPRGAPDQTCPVGRNIQPALGRITDQAEAAFMATLAAASLKDIVQEIKAESQAA